TATTKKGSDRVKKLYPRKESHKNPRYQKQTRTERQYVIGVDYNYDADVKSDSSRVGGWMNQDSGGGMGLGDGDEDEEMKEEPPSRGGGSSGNGSGSRAAAGEP